ncbi:MAG: hypothetical protein GEU83_16250 [Pseudonocardiaceae bacterium]|nr:hypothetical protein [Pseudonocardiaceae bacterium]
MRVSPRAECLRELLCLLYLLLFPDIVGEFVLSGIFEGAELATPSAAEQELSEDIASWVAGKVRKLIPNPCHVDFGSPPRNRSVSKVARNLVDTAVDRALGIEGGEVDRDPFVDISVPLRPQPGDPAVEFDLDEDLPREHP